MTERAPRPNAALLAIAYASFVALGLYDALLGVAWPSIRDTFGVSLDALGLILAGGTAGFFLVSFNMGRILSRLGAGRTLLLGHTLRGVGVFGFVVAPFWWTVLLAALVGGLGGGMVDAGLNTYVATHHRANQMNWLHANYGIGSTLGPLLGTAMLTAGRAWQLSYAVVAAANLLLGLSVVATLARWQRRPVDVEGAGASLDGLALLRMPVIWAGVFVYFLITGLEVTLGGWTFTLFTEARGIAESVAGQWVSIYWGSFTVARLLMGLMTDRIGPVLLVRAGMVGGTVGAVLLWWNPTNAVSFGALVLLGASLAPLFPVLIALTPSRLGEERAQHVIGYQISGASLGAVGLPGLAGVLADSISLEIIGPFVLFFMIFMAVLNEVVAAATRRRFGVRPPA